MTKKNWSIRKAVIDDAEKLNDCMKLAYFKYLDRLNGKRLPPLEVDYKEEIDSFPVWVAESGNKIVGGLIVMFENDYMTIANVAVNPNFQGNGLGRGLMDFASSEAKHKGYSEMRLATHVSFKENVIFYNHLGWSEFERDDTRVYMSKMISH